MLLTKRLYKFLLKKKNKDLYNDISILINHINKNNITNIVIDSNKLSIYYKKCIYLSSIFYPLNIYFYNSDVIKNKLIITNSKFKQIITNKYKKITLNKSTHKYGQIYFKINMVEFILNWDKINEFCKIYIKFLLQTMNKLHLKNINITNLSNLYVSYFLPIIMVLDYPIINNYTKETLIITNSVINNVTNNTIFIADKYTINYPNTQNILFYSCALKQFLLYNVVLKQDKIIGKLFNIYRVLNNKCPQLKYNCYKIDLPKTYKQLSTRVILINKNSSRLIGKSNSTCKINSSHFLKFCIKNSLNNLLYISINYRITKLEGYKIYQVLLHSFSQLNCKNYHLNCKNYYIYNEYKPLKNTLFSLLIYTNHGDSTIIINISRGILFLEKYILKKIDTIIIDLIYLKDITISSEIISIKDNKLEIYLISEIVFFFIQILYIIPKLIINLYINIDKSMPLLKRLQYIYNFTNDDITILNNKAEMLMIPLNKLFIIIILKALSNLYKYKLIIYGNHTGNYIIPALFKNININNCNKILQYIFNAKIGQSFINSVLFYNKGMCSNNSQYLIQIDELDNIDKFDNINIFKLNLLAETNKIPIQIGYCINKYKCMLTISASENIKNIDEIIEYIFNTIQC